MDGSTIARYLRELCDDMDCGRPLRPFLSIRRCLAPVALPALVGISMGLAGCDVLETAGCVERDLPAPVYGAPPLSEAIDCGDGEDNDRDGLVDCEDPECAGLAPCAMSVQDRIAPPPAEEYGAPRAPMPPEPTKTVRDGADGGASDAGPPDASQGSLKLLVPTGPRVGELRVRQADTPVIVYGRPFEEPEPADESDNRE